MRFHVSVVIVDELRQRNCMIHPRCRHFGVVLLLLVIPAKAGIQLFAFPVVFAQPIKAKAGFQLSLE